MTKLLDKMIARVRTWPVARQNDAAEILLAMEEGTEPYKLSYQQREAIEIAQEEVERGEIATDKEVSAMWKTHGA